MKKINPWKSVLKHPAIELPSEKISRELTVENNGKWKIIETYIPGGKYIIASGYNSKLSRNGEKEIWCNDTKKMIRYHI